MELALPPDPTTLDRPMTVEEWLQVPDGPPYPELIDGELVVNPSPLTDHQVVVGNLYVLLRAACPSQLHVMQDRPGGNEAPFTGQRPFPVTIEPARLLD